MLEHLINIEVIKNIIDTDPNPNPIVKIMDNLFVNSDIVSYYNYTYLDNKEKITQLSYIYQLEDGRYVLSNKFFKDDIIDENSINMEIVNTIVNFSKIFEKIQDLVSYLRKAKEDHAIDYDLRNSAKYLISQLYKNGCVEIDSVLNII